MSGFLGGLMNKAMGALGNQAGEQVGGSLGNMLQGEGLQMLINQARSSGLEDKVRSWIGNGENLPISVDEIRSLLSDQQVQQIVSKTGLPAAVIMPALAELLPAAVDHATPEGTATGQTGAPTQV
ncbi:YidB family protein [Tanticharoenia sakaeratensis]|jgi:uncharacterized protein YidB (DUF937 family)|uniref:DUF937 domain-containing protein n=1 Tax=Tanticharoenia sakaeratensis NBRC 103193 TaxID=1231623 RepID=A0A0D6MIU9_9PROT|nr:YidB family protein [Tanticharoenia sakaeratensis]GAN53584.1 hypothetical protein Tasa_010_131 [Tanticharoenia sakaeratensis NBRC 103193]GBQ17482.1 hypothetical protein AA103193_0356 [Tanticharoenia sakaeratensis NBRC 103193]